MKPQVPAGCSAEAWAGSPSVSGGRLWQPWGGGGGTAVAAPDAAPTPAGTFPRVSRAAPFPARSPTPWLPQTRGDGERCQALGCAAALGGHASGSPRVLPLPWEGETAPKVVPGSPHSFPGSPHSSFPGAASKKHSVKVTSPSSNFFRKGFDVNGGREKAKSKPLW